MPLAVWLLSLVRPIVGRVLLALGISLVTVTGVTASIDALRTQLVGSVNRLPSDVLNLFMLAGGGEAIGIILGAITTKLLMVQASSALKFINTNRG